MSIEGWPESSFPKADLENRTPEFRNIKKGKEKRAGFSPARQTSF
jgi:hypothetical protein